MNRVHHGNEHIESVDGGERADGCVRVQGGHRGRNRVVASCHGVPPLRPKGCRRRRRVHGPGGCQLQPSTPRQQGDANLQGRPRSGASGHSSLFAPRDGDARRDPLARFLGIAPPSVHASRLGVASRSPQILCSETRGATAFTENSSLSRCPQTAPVPANGPQGPHPTQPRLDSPREEVRHPSLATSFPAQAPSRAEAACRGNPSGATVGPLPLPPARQKTVACCMSGVIPA